MWRVFKNFLLLVCEFVILGLAVREFGRSLTDSSSEGERMCSHKE